MPMCFQEMNLNNSKTICYIQSSTFLQPVSLPKLSPDSLTGLYDYTELETRWSGQVTTKLPQSAAAGHRCALSHQVHHGMHRFGTRAAYSDCQTICSIQHTKHFPSHPSDERIKSLSRSNGQCSPSWDGLSSIAALKSSKDTRCCSCVVSDGWLLVSIGKLLLCFPLLDLSSRQIKAWIRTWLSIIMLVIIQSTFITKAFRI